MAYPFTSVMHFTLPCIFTSSCFNGVTGVEYTHSLGAFFNANTTSSIISGSINGSSPWMLTTISYCQRSLAGLRAPFRPIRDRLVRHDHVPTSFHDRVSNSFVVRGDHQCVQLRRFLRLEIRSNDHRFPSNHNERLPRESCARVSGGNDAENFRSLLFLLLFLFWRFGGFGSVGFRVVYVLFRDFNRRVAGALESTFFPLMPSWCFWKPKIPASAPNANAMIDFMLISCPLCPLSVRARGVFAG